LSIFTAIACCTCIALLLISGIGEAQVESVTQKLLCEINLMKNKLFTDKKRPRYFSKQIVAVKLHEPWTLKILKIKQV
jgi:hypothetical protein